MSQLPRGCPGVSFASGKPTWAIELDPRTHQEQGSGEEAWGSWAKVAVAEFEGWVQSRKAEMRGAHGEEVRVMRSLGSEQ